MKRFGTGVMTLFCLFGMNLVHADRLSDALVTINQSTVPHRVSNLRKIDRTRSILKSVAWVAFLGAGAGAASVIRIPSKFVRFIPAFKAISLDGGIFLLADSLVFSIFPTPGQKIRALEPSQDFFKLTFDEQYARASQSPELATFLIDLADRIGAVGTGRPN